MNAKTRYDNLIFKIEEGAQDKNTDVNTIMYSVVSASAFSAVDLNSIFSFMTGHSLRQYIKVRKLMAAYRFLVDADVKKTTSTAAISTAIDISDFDNQSSFTKKFSAFFHLTPKDGIVPSWQKELFFVNDYVELAYVRKQREFFRAADCDTSVLDYVIANSYCGCPIRNEKKFHETKDEARRRRERKNLAQWSVAAQNNTSAKSEWFLEHTDNELEKKIYHDVICQAISSPVLSKHKHLFTQNGMSRLYSVMWRHDVKIFFYKWITAFEMAAQGKIPSWQINWSPEFQSDHLCFAEQIRIMKKFGYDPWPLLQQLPRTSLTKHRTLEAVLFDKSRRFPVVTPENE